MAKASKTKAKATLDEVVEININALDFDSAVYLNDSSLQYALSTLDRAIPGIDGLKDAQRKAIFTMSSVRGEIKTVSAAGRMISDGIYLHGDAPAAKTLSQLASPVANSIPLLGSRGGFGTPVNPESASPRYTYVKTNTATERLILVDKDVVPMVENYDGSTMEPKFFLPLIPVALMGANGLATAYRCTILSRTLPEIIDNTLRALDGKALKPMVPDLTASGANIRVDVDPAEPTKFRSYGIVEIVDSSTIRIRGLAYGMKVEAFLDKLVKMQETNLIKDYDDASSSTINILVKLPRGTASGWTEEDVYSYFGLMTKLNEYLNLQTASGKIRSYGSIDDIIHDYIPHRLKYYVKRYQKLLDDAERKLAYHMLQVQCFENDMISKVKSFSSRTAMVDFVKSLNTEILATDEDVQNIVQFPAYRWTVEGRAKLDAEMNANIEKIQEYLELLDSEEKIRDQYRKELQDLKTVKFI